MERIIVEEEPESPTQYVNAPTKRIKKSHTQFNEITSTPKPDISPKKQADLRSFLKRMNTDSSLESVKKREFSLAKRNTITIESEISYNEEDDASSNEKAHVENLASIQEEESKATIYKDEDLKLMPNVAFYLNKIPSKPNGDFIDSIHKYWKRDFEKLERHHGYIQWLFPNFYGSNYNDFAYKLTREEAKIFREDKQIAERVVRSYELILEFYGMVIEDQQTGKLARNSRNYAKRYHETLITSLHNHLRVRRILAHLNIVGFRDYAIELVNFLEIETFGYIGGFQDYQKNKNNVAYCEKFKSNPLFPIAKYSAFKDWMIYGKVTTDEDLKILYKNCFSEDPEDYKPSVFFEKFKVKKAKDPSLQKETAE